MLAQTPYSSFREFGQHLGERGPEVVTPYITNTTYLILAALAAAGAIAAMLVAARWVGPLQALAHNVMFARPGEVLMGYTPGRLLSKKPIYAAASDQMYHSEIVGPSGQAKTSLMISLMRQHMRSHMTVFATELLGDLRDKALQQAYALGIRIYYADPSVPTSMKYNPLAGPTELVAQRAVYTFKAAAQSGKEQFFKNFNSIVLHYFVKAVSRWAHATQNREPTLSDLRDFATSVAVRAQVLGLSRSGNAQDTNGKADGKGKGKDNGPLLVTAPYIDADTRAWFEGQYLYEFTSRQRGEFTSGLKTIVEELLAVDMLREWMTPGPEDPVLKFDRDTLASGGLVMPCIPFPLLGAAAGQVVSTWLLMDFVQSVNLRGKGGYPVMAFLDEVHRMLGHQNTELAEEFATFLTGARHMNVGCHLAFQSYSLIPEVLKDNLATNTGCKLLSGRMGHMDALEAIGDLGYAPSEVKDRRSTHRGLVLGVPSAYSVGSREMEMPEVSEQDLRYLPRGWWYYHQVINGQLQHPIKLHATRAPRPKVSFGVKPVMDAEVYRAFGGDRVVAAGSVPQNDQQDPEELE